MNNKPNSLANVILQNINANMEESIKAAGLVQKAKDAADIARKASQQKYSVARNQVSEAMITLKKELERMLDEDNKAAETAYNDKLIELGLKSEDHPFQPIVTKADETAKGALGILGNIIKAVDRSFDYVKDGVNATRKS